MTKPENMVLRTLYLPKALDLELREQAFRASVTKGELLRTLITEALAARRGQPKNKGFGRDAKVKISSESQIVRAQDVRIETVAAKDAPRAAKPAQKTAKAAGAPKRLATA